MTLATRIEITLPDWVLDEVEGAPLGTDEERIALTNRLARRNFLEGTGGPFAAIVVDAATGELVSVGVNLVLGSGLSVTHAEVVALSLAQVGTGDWDLGAAGARRELYVNGQPCVQCYGATMWSGVTRVVMGADGAEIERLTKFDEGPLPHDWVEQFEQRGIAVVRDVLREEALDVHREYGALVASGGVTVYNARGAGAIDKE